MYKFCFFALQISLIASILVSCGSNEPEYAGPTSITVSHTTIYEKLPLRTNIASLETDITADNIRFTLTSGDGSTDNSDFTIEGNYLKSQRKFETADIGEKNIRIKVSDGITQYEEAYTIEIIALGSDAPVLSSNAFTNNSEMPREYGADNGNVSPSLLIENVPAQANSIVITMRDKDSSNAYHWSVWNIPTNKVEIFSNQTWGSEVVVGNTSFGDGYTGPFPPTRHTYRISAHFLSEKLDLTSDEYGKLDGALIGKLVAQATLVGTYTP